MLKGIKWTQVTIISIVSLLFLFGGWYLYQNLSIKSPINEAVSSIDGIKVAELDIDKKNVNLSLNLYSIDNFQSTYNLVEDTVAPYLKNRTLNIDIVNKGNENLSLAWSESYFYIAEAIEKREYSLIPKAIDTMQQEYNLDRAGYTMDATKIYIDLHQDETSLYIVIPRENDIEVSERG